MTLKPYYCPHCKRFKWSWQVANVYAHDFDFGNCKHCGTKCVDTEAAIVMIIESVWLCLKEENMNEENN